MKSKTKHCKVIVDLIVIVDNQENIVMSNKDKAQDLCDFFSSVFSKEPCDNFVTSPTCPLVVNIGGLVLMFDSVLSKLAKIKVNKSAGPDSICPRVLYELRYEISVFTRESSYCFQRILAIAILSVPPSVCHMGGSVKNGARRWTLVSGTVKLFHKFEGGHPEQGR